MSTHPIPVRASASPGRGRISEWLAGAPLPVFNLYAGTAAFCAYFSMYAFRKPFAAGRYEAEGVALLGGIDLKTAYVVSQILGYMVSKYIGVRVC